MVQVIELRVGRTSRLDLAAANWVVVGIVPIIATNIGRRDVTGCQQEVFKCQTGHENKMDYPAIGRN